MHKHAHGWPPVEQVGPTYWFFQQLTMKKTHRGNTFNATTATDTAKMAQCYELRKLQ